MKTDDWEKTYWADRKGNRTTIKELLKELEGEPTVGIRLADLAHIPPTRIEARRKLVADLSFPIIVQEKNGVYKRILDCCRRQQSMV